MTSSCTSTKKESTPMRTTSRLFRIVLVAGGPVVLHRSGFVLGHQLQTAPPVVAQPVSAQSADNGFDWADAAIGALVASVVLILAAVAATHVRPRQTVQP